MVRILFWIKVMTRLRQRFSQKGQVFIDSGQLLGTDQVVLVLV